MDYIYGCRLIHILSILPFSKYTNKQKIKIMNMLKEIKFYQLILIIILIFGGYWFVVGNIEAYKIGWFHPEDLEPGIDRVVTILIPLIDIILGFLVVLPNIVGNWTKKLSGLKFFYIGDDVWASQNDNNYRYQ